MITFSSVTKEFTESGFTLEKITFHIDKGELVVLTGHSGSGKTTLMRLLTREYLPTAGEIKFGDIDVVKLKTSLVPFLRRKIGVVFQDYKLLPELNIWENIALPLSIVNKPQAEIESRVTDLLKLVDLTERAFLFPSQLSGGEAQRVSIARALAIGPEVIFADEPTGNLDRETSLAITRLLSKINELGTTLILATHDSDVLHALADTRHIHLEGGRLVQDTHPKQPGTTPPAVLPTPAVTSPVKPVEKSSKKTEKGEKPAPKADKPVKSVVTEPPASTDQPKTTPAQSKKPASKPRFSLGLPSLKLPFGKKPAAKAAAPAETPTDTATKPATSPKTPNKKTDKPKTKEPDEEEVIIEVETLD